MGAGALVVAALLGGAVYWLVLLRRSRLQGPAGGRTGPPDRGRLLKIAAVLLLGLGTGVSLLFAVAEMAGGDVAGIQHLLPACILGGLIWLGWTRPRAGGIILLALAAAAVIAVAVAAAVDAVRPDALWGASAVVLVPALAGLLLLSAARGDRASR